MDEMQTIKVKQDTELGYKIIYLSDFNPDVDVEYLEPKLESEEKATKTNKVSKSKAV